MGPTRLGEAAQRPWRVARLLLPVLLFGAGACGDATPALILAATTSTYDSGLLDSLVSRFRRETPGLVVRTIVVGSGEALELARRGDADVILVHAPRAERRFVADGHAAERVPVMFNDFLLVGPPADPAGVSGILEPARALARIAEAGETFVSRGDSSGTHEREIAFWAEAGITPRGAWYVESGQGQGTTLQIASERRAYALADRATFDVLRDILDLVPVVEGDASLMNVYSVIIPVAAAHPDEATVLASWLTSESGRRAIADFRLPGAADPLFTPMPATGTPH